MTETIFVYGTLLPGQSNAEQVEGAVDLGPALVEGWVLVDLGPYPAIVRGTGTVRGRLLAVTAEHLAALDAFEGVPTLYQRVRVTTDAGEAWAWVMRSAQGRVVPGGDWLRRALLATALLAGCATFGPIDDPTPSVPPLGDDDDAADDDAADDDTAPVDADGDGVAADEDCDDGDAAVFPGAPETCDGVDEDCDGAVDDGAIRTWWSDADGDTWGGAEVPGPCDGAPDLVERAGDCDDGDASFHPGADAQDGVDADCDGRNEWLVTLYISGDDAFEYCLDTEEPMLGGGENWQTGFVFEHWLDAGNHLLGIRGWDTGRVITAAIADVRTSAGVVLVSDGGWRFDPNPAADASSRTGWCGVGFDDSTWQTVQVIGPIGTSPWGNAPAVFPPGSTASWIWDYYPVDLNTQYLRGRFTLP